MVTNGWQMRVCQKRKHGSGTIADRAYQQFVHLQHNATYIRRCEFSWPHSVSEILRRTKMRCVRNTPGITTVVGYVSSLWLRKKIQRSIFFSNLILYDPVLAGMQCLTHPHLPFSWCRGARGTCMNLAGTFRLKSALLTPAMSQSQVSKKRKFVADGAWTKTAHIGGNRNV